MYTYIYIYIYERYCTFFRTDHLDKKTQPCHLCQVRGLTHFWLGRSVGVAAISEWLCSVGLGPQRIWKGMPSGSAMQIWCICHWCGELGWGWWDTVWRLLCLEAKHAYHRRESPERMVGNREMPCNPTADVSQSLKSAWQDTNKGRAAISVVYCRTALCFNWTVWVSDITGAYLWNWIAWKGAYHFFHVLCILPTMHVFPVHLSGSFVHSSPFFWASDRRNCGASVEAGCQPLQKQLRLEAHVKTTKPLYQNCCSMIQGCNLPIICHLSR